MRSTAQRRGGNGWPLAKSLTLIPTLYPASLAYGWNMLNPAHTFDRWRVRNVIVWARPNPPVGALGDKVRPATSYITVACTSAKRWFDLDAVRTEPTKEPQRHLSQNDLRSGRTPTEKRGTNELGAYISDDIVSRSHPAGAPPLDWWEDDDPTGHATLVLPTQPYPGAHYATWPESLIARLI
jgi:site-specific DNA-methyltransferase (adenine-specific)